MATTPAPDPKRPWLKPMELAARERVSRRTVWTWAEKGIVEVRRRPGRAPRMRLVDEDDD